VRFSTSSRQDIPARTLPPISGSASARSRTTAQRSRGRPVRGLCRMSSTQRSARIAA
jgi:hypothetical protein